MLMLVLCISGFFTKSVFALYSLSIRASQGGSVGKESTCNAGDMGSILVSGRSPGEGHGQLAPVLLPSRQESPNPVDRGAWWAVVHSVVESQTQLKRFSTQHRRGVVDNL